VINDRIIETFQGLPAEERVTVDGAKWVAVVDDDAAVRRGLIRLLRSHGIHAESFESIQPYLGRAASDPPACLVLDVGLGASRVEPDLLDKLESAVVLPIILVSGQAEGVPTLLSRQGGVRAFLLKPFDPRKLLESIRSHLTRDLGGLPA
jgi:FixJ family two-component response regulator